MPFSVPAKTAATAKVRPHIVGRIVQGETRFRVYAWRGGPLVLWRDGVRPTREEAIEAAWPVCLEASRALFLVRPKAIQRLIETAETDRWVYFVGASDGLIKIGAAHCVPTRLKTMQAHCPVRLKVFAKVKGGEALEAAYHEHYARHRKHGEWFDRCPEILAEIDRLNFTTPATIASLEEAA